MARDDAVQEKQSSPWDPAVEELGALRLTAGSPSFGRIAELITERRVAAGAAPAAARVARSTVYDTFRTGRPRVNLDLLREAALALGADDVTVDAWLDSCQEGSAVEASAAPTDPAPTDPPRETHRSLSRRELSVLLLGCVLFNLLGRAFVDFFDLPVYLDMVGTAVAAVVLGPWWGAAVGASTNVIGAAGSGLISVPFGLVNVAGALVWGYGVHRFGMGRTLPRFFSLNVLVALVCSAIAVPIIVASGIQTLRVGDDVITQLVRESFDTFLVAASLSNLLTSQADKLIGGFLVLVIVSALPWRLRGGVPLVLADHRPGSPDGDRPHTQEANGRNPSGASARRNSSGISGER